MPPQNQNLNSGGAYDFLNQAPQESSKRLKLPKLPKLAWIILIASVSILGILVLLAMVFGGRRADSNIFIDNLALSQEIIRVSDLVQEMPADPNTKSLAATTSTLLLSANTELSGYLQNGGIKVDPKLLASKNDSQIDQQLQTAQQSNSLNRAYGQYLKQQLAAYKDSLAVAHEESGPEGKNLLAGIYENVDILLTSELIKSVP